MFGKMSALRHKLPDPRQTTCIDMIELRQRKARGISQTTRGVAFIMQSVIGHDRAESLVPIIEITSNQQGSAVRHLPINELLQQIHLTDAAGAKQSQMHHDDVHMPALNIDHRMQQSALLKTVIGDVLVLMLDNRPARNQGIAMLAMRRHRIGDVDRLVTRRRQIFGL